MNHAQRGDVNEHTRCKQANSECTTYLHWQQEECLRFLRVRQLQLQLHDPPVSSKSADRACLELAAPSKAQLQP